jgi:hypothetical protein
LNKKFEGVGRREEGGRRRGGPNINDLSNHFSYNRT